MVLRFLKNNIFLFLLVIFSLPTIFALFHNGFFVSDDGEWMIIRLSAFFETLRSGEIPVRFIGRLNNGYGYPIGDFIYPGFLYLGSLIHLLGFGFIKSIKIIFGASMVLSGVFTYLWISKLFPKTAAFFGGLLYVYIPYHLYDVYTRGSIGEVLALCVVPFIFWQIERKDFVLTACGIGMLVLSHNTVAFLFVIPLYLYLVLRMQGKLFSTLVIASLPCLLGALLSLFFWGPALYDLQYTVFKSVVISDWRTYFADISLIGYSSLIVIVAGLFAVLKKNISQTSVAILFLSLAFIGIFLASSYSFLFWTVFPSSLVQFPFRMLSLVIPAAAFLTASFLSLWEKKVQIIFGLAFVLVTVVCSYPYLFPKAYTKQDDMYYISNFSTTTVKDEYMPIWVKQSVPPLAQEKVAVIKGKGTIANEVQKGNKISFVTNVVSSGTVQINSVYFPGWKANVDGKEHEIKYDNTYGLLQLPLSSGNHTIAVQFTETPIRLIADILSLGTALILAVLFFTKVRYNAIKLT
jgi:hypothetical protein